MVVLSQPSRPSSELNGPAQRIGRLVGAFRQVVLFRRSDLGCLVQNPRTVNCAGVLFWMHDLHHEVAPHDRQEVLRQHSACDGRWRQFGLREWNNNREAPPILPFQVEVLQRFRDEAPVCPRRQRHREPTVLVGIVASGEIAIGTEFDLPAAMRPEQRHAHQQASVLFRTLGHSYIRVDLRGVREHPLAQAPRAGIVLVLWGDSDASEEPPKVVALLALGVGLNVARQPPRAEVLDDEVRHALAEAHPRIVGSVHLVGHLRCRWPQGSGRRDVLPQAVEISSGPFDRQRTALSAEDEPNANWCRTKPGV